MGLTSFLGELPSIKDISIAKNYLNESELKILNNLVSGYFDIAEVNAIEHKPMYMEDYLRQLDSVLSSGNRKLLEGSGSVSHKQAIKASEKIHGSENWCLETILQEKINYHLYEKLGYHQTGQIEHISDIMDIVFYEKDS